MNVHAEYRHPPVNKDSLYSFFLYIYTHVCLKELPYSLARQRRLVYNYTDHLPVYVEIITQ